MFNGYIKLKVDAVADAVTAGSTVSNIRLLLAAVEFVEPLLIQIRKTPAAEVAVVVLDLTFMEFTMEPFEPAVNTVLTVPVPSNAVLAFAANKFAQLTLGVSV